MLGIREGRLTGRIRQTSLIPTESITVDALTKPMQSAELLQLLTTGKVTMYIYTSTSKSIEISTPISKKYIFEIFQRQSGYFCASPVFSALVRFFLCLEIFSGWGWTTSPLCNKLQIPHESQARALDTSMENLNSILLRFMVPFFIGSNSVLHSFLPPQAPEGSEVQI